MKIEVTLDIEVLPPGEGFSMIDYKEKEQLTNRSILAEIKMIIEKNIKGEVAVTRGFLNNVPRRFTFDSCANSSVIINTNNSEKDRRFRIIKPSKKCMEAESEFTGTYHSEDEDDDDSNRDQNAQIIQNIEDIKEVPMPGMEIRISVRDILEGLKQCEDVLNNDDDSAMVTFMLRIEDPGTGNLPANCTELRASMKTISGKLSLVLSIADNIEISRCFLNGIQREVSVEPEALRSIIFITEKPWRNRRFSIKNRVSNNDYLEEDVDTDTEKDNSEDEEDVDTRAEKDNIEVNAGTNMNNNGKTNVHNKKGKERYFIYKKATKTYREAIPFKDSIVRKDEVDDVTKDDPRKGGKLKENKSQKNILGGESLYNKVYQGVADLSNAVMLS